jgi:hypothetical protein
MTIGTVTHYLIGFIVAGIISSLLLVINGRFSRWLSLRGKRYWAKPVREERDETYVTLYGLRDDGVHFAVRGLLRQEEEARGVLEHYLLAPAKPPSMSEEEYRKWDRYRQWY